MRRTETEIISHLQARVGKPVLFTYPAAEGTREGRIVDCVVVRGSNTRGVPYYDVVDLIAFEGEPEHWMRISYYRHLPDDRLLFAGQTSIAEPVSVWTRILAAASTRPWFPKNSEASSPKSL